MPLGWKITRIKGIYLLGLKIMPRMRTIVSRNRLLRSLPGWRIMLLLHLLTLINLRGWKLVLRAIIRRRGWKRQKVQQPIVAAMYLLGQKMQDEHNLPLNRISMPVSQQRINLHGWQKHNKTSVKVKLQVLRWPKETVKRESVQLLGPKTVTTAHRSKGTAGSDSKVSRYKSRKNSYKKNQAARSLREREEENGEGGEEYDEIAWTNGGGGWAICLEGEVRSLGAVEKRAREIGIVEKKEGRRGNKIKGKIGGIAKVEVETIRAIEAEVIVIIRQKAALANQAQEKAILIKPSQKISPLKFKNIAHFINQRFWKCKRRFFTRSLTSIKTLP